MQRNVKRCAWGTRIVSVTGQVTLLDEWLQKASYRMAGTTGPVFRAHREPRPLTIVSGFTLINFAANIRIACCAIFIKALTLDSYLDRLIYLDSYLANIFK